MSILSSLRRRPCLPRIHVHIKCSLHVPPKQLPPFIDVHPEVQHAFQTSQPVVALESTIITHGMPYPTNLSTAQSVENIVRSTGSVPATIAIIGGRVKIGIEERELARLADVEGTRPGGRDGPVKVSRRDVGAAIAMGRDGGTTCSATLIFAALAGIKVFATGGLGGVHRGAENSMDVSADLHELTRCPVGLVSAGVKSILDIGRTLEYLETLGVPVVTYGETDDFPAFYSPKSGFKSPWRVNDPMTAAKVLHTQSHLSLSTGVLFGVPIPQSHWAAAEPIQAAVEQAVGESEENGMSRRGKEVTPWLLKRVGELTGGKSLKSNVALIENSALVGGQMAVAYAKLAKEESEIQGKRISTVGSTFHPSIQTQSTAPPEVKPSPPTHSTKADLVVLGSAAIDITSQASPSSVTSSPSNELHVHSTSPGKVSLSLGGVGRNVAEAAHRSLSYPSNDTRHSVALVSPIGDDAFGRVLTEEIRGIGMRTDGLFVAEERSGRAGVGKDIGRTAVCNMILDGMGGLVGGVADMDVVFSLDGKKALEHLKRLEPKIVAMDANLDPETIKVVIKYCNEQDITTFFEPTSIIKSTAILPAIASSLELTPSPRSPITFASPNLLELAHLYHSARSDHYNLTSHETWWRTIDEFSLGSEFRNDLEHLSRRNTCSEEDQMESKRTLGFLVDGGIAQMAVNLLPFFQHLVVKCGDLGIIVVMRTNEDSAWTGKRSNVYERCIVAKGRSGGQRVVLKHFPALKVEKETIVNVTGAGDSLVGSILSSLVQNAAVFDDPQTLEDAIAVAQRSAVLTLQSSHAVSPRLSDHGKGAV